jgi:hypothetical protein
MRSSSVFTRALSTPRRPPLVTAVLLAMIALPLPGVAGPATAHAQTAQAAVHRYDRQGLIDLTEDYLSALVAHSPSEVPLAHDLQTVENLQRIRPGEGLWATASGGPTSFAIHVPDPKRQTAGFIGMMERDGEPILLGLRLQAKRGRIVQAEHLIAAGIAEANLPNLQTPRPGLLAEIPRGERLPAHELRAIGATYYNALDDNDGSLAPFAPDCERHENGLVTAGPNLPPSPPIPGFPAVAADCTGQLDSQIFTYVGRIDNRRVFAADPVTGLAMGLSHFRHPMDNVPYDVILADGSVVSFAPDFDPFDLPAAHIFKIGADRRLHEIEATGFVAPFNSPTGW